MNINSKHKRTKLIQRMFNETMISMIFTEISLTVATMVDGFTVSRFLGHEAMAALGLVAALPTFIALVAGILNSGAQGIAAKKLAESDVPSARKLFNFILFFSTVVGLIVTTLIVLFSDQVLLILGVRRNMGNVWILAKNYLYGLSFSIVANIIIISIMPFLYLDGARQRVTTAITYNVIINVILDFVVVLIFHRGIFAVGLATSIATYVEFFCFVGHFLKKDSIFKPSLRMIDFSYVLPVFSKGMPVAVRRAANIVRKISINRIIATVASSYGLAALATQNSIKDFGDALGTGIGLTTLLLAGITIGEQNKKDVKELLRSGAAKACMLISVSIVLGVIAKPIAMLYSSDAMTIEYTTFAIRAYACSLPLVAMNTIYSNYLQGSGNINYANLLGVFQRLICIVPSVFILSKIAGIKGTFIAFPISEILVMICIVIFIQVKTRKFRVHFDDFLMLPADFSPCV